jgi:polar amino acid transport system substrate-binding protein
MSHESSPPLRQNRRDAMRAAVVSAVAGAGLVAAQMGAATQAQAQAAEASRGSKLREVLDRGHLIVGTGTDAPPLYFREASGRHAGFDPDLARVLAKGLFNDPEKVEFVVQGSDARIPSLLSNRVDVVLQNLTVTPGRAQQVEFTVPYYRAGNGLLLLASGPHRDYAALRAAGERVTVSTLQNVMIESWVHMALPAAKVEQYPSPDAALQALNAGRSDALVGDYARIRWAVAQFPERYRDSGYSWLPNSIAAGVRPGEQAWLNWLNTAIREAMTGVDFPDYARIYKRWLDVDVSEPKTGYPRESNP